MKEKLLKILSDATVTRGLEPADLEQLLQRATVDIVPQGRIVLAEGQHSDALYVVLSGCLKVMLLTANRKNHVNRVRNIALNTLSPGDCFGEYSLIDSEPVSASIMAAEPSLLLKITKTTFDTTLAVNDRLAKIIYRNLLHILVRRLRKKDQALDLNLDVLEQMQSMISAGRMESPPPQPAQPGIDEVAEA
ncbi:MAG: cyclic nucleotide-binding domain-containing protein [Candidatus Competibacteraceae bacterium]